MSESPGESESHQEELVDRENLVFAEASSHGHLENGALAAIPEETPQESSRICDADSDDEVGIIRTKKRVQILSDNSDDDDFPAANNSRTTELAVDREDDQADKEASDEALDAVNTNTESVGKYNGLRFLCDDDSSEEEQIAEVEIADPKKGKVKKPKTSRKKDLKKSKPEIESEGSHDSEEEDKKKEKNRRKKTEKPKKISKREREEVEAKKTEIYSMIQKNAREEVIDVPYNKPEQYELKEFLSRLQESKVTLPIDKKLAKKTGKLRALKSEKPIIVQEDDVKENESNIEIVEESPKQNMDEIDLLVAGTSKQTEKRVESKTKVKVTLQGDPNSVIDLDSGLVAPKAKPKGVALIEKCILQNVKPSAAVVTDAPKVEHIPGVAYKILMESLGQELLRKKKQQMQKYIEDQEKGKMQQLANEIDDEAEFVDSCEDDDEMEEDKLNDVVEQESKDQELEQETEVKEDCQLEGDENEIPKDGEVSHEEENDASDEDSDAEDQLTEKNKKLRKRIVNVDDEDSDDEILAPPENINLFPGFEQNTCVTESQVEKDEMELFELCTGKFETQAPAQEMVTGQLEGNISQEDTEVMKYDDEVHVEPNFESSDEDNPAVDTQAKKKSRKARIYLTDEEDNAPTTQKDEDCASEGEDSISNPPEGLSDQEECQNDAQNVEYDSEENEIDSSALPPPKPKMKVTDFMEQEAELSESDWGSADEDEKDLDKLDIELGDEDQFDQNQLQSELERIHMKKLLDQDAREVKMVKNLVLHEEEREGMTRERTFRWLHVDNDVNLHGEIRPGNQDDDLRESDEENEELWRKIRHERDVVLKEQLGSELSSIFETKNVTILKPSIPEDPMEVKAPTFLVPEQDKLSRKSLLLQDEEYLARLAGMASKTTDVLINGATEKGSFVFRQMAKQDGDQESTVGKRKSESVLAPIKGKKRKKTSIYG